MQTCESSGKFLRHILHRRTILTFLDCSTVSSLPSTHIWLVGSSSETVSKLRRPYTNRSEKKNKDRKAIIFTSKASNDPTKGIAFANYVCSFCTTIKFNIN